MARSPRLTTEGGLAQAFQQARPFNPTELGRVLTRLKSFPVEFIYSDSELMTRLVATIECLRDSQRVRDARVEAPAPKQDVLVWTGCHWTYDWYDVGDYEEVGWGNIMCGIDDFPFWLPMPSAPGVAG